MMSISVKLLRAFASTLLAGLVALPTVGLSQERKSTLDEVMERGVLRAGVRYEHPPNGYMDATGTVQGFGPDVAREFARHLGVKVEFVQETSQTRIPLLLSGQIDASFGATTPTRSREEVVDFSLVWTVEQAVIVVPAGAPKDPVDYYKSGKTIGSTQGAVFVDYWKAKDPDAKFKLFQQADEALVALIGGQVDAVLLNGVQAQEMVKNIGGGKLEIGKSFYDDPSAIMMRQNDSRWRNWINWGLQRLAADGTLARLYKKHYGSDFTLDVWQNGMLQPGVLTVGEKNDIWKN